MMLKRVGCKNNWILNRLSRDSRINEILYSLSLSFCRYPFKLIKVPTPYGWVTTFTCVEGLSYMVGRPGEKKLVDHLLLEPGWTVIDAGANIGWYTLIMSKNVGKKGKVLALEPEPLNFAVLSRNIKDNNLKNVLAFQVALSDQDGYTKLQLSKNPATHSIMTKGSNFITVKTMKLDTLLKEFKIHHVNFLKIDVEGAEMKVLSGAQETLRKKPNILMETWSFETKSKKVMKAWREGESEDFLRGANYEVTWIDKRNLFARPKIKTRD